ncbi:ADP-ribosylglycohydrolase family protein [Lentzea sp. BCCO 10_0061]|uniref:ADP-ribosylglycohydrolase family protein n=1 Tax=Lentzea sokolovensis TaxID=3095429 RepID=A0ABU4VDP7_9PSEU|nr:ADP-ribosylglycohydrolase family protein [Lentzea sp. BCCO 10_0061]MDX8149933.1 ADP-ribosylglycohydrolase family protein [Lentzea sp. BCCO 10_0061]
MLVHLAIGDAYGAGFEYADPDFVAAHNTVRGYVQNPGLSGLHPGRYTDDTQMTIAVAEMLLSGASWTQTNLAEQFVRTFHRDQRVGYASNFYDLLCEVSDGTELLRRIRPHSDKSGAAMRAGPIGLLPAVSDVVQHAEVQARITHDTPLGIEAAQAAALAVHYCHFELGPLADAGRWIDQKLGSADRWSEPWSGPVGAQGWMSVRAALTALSSNTSLTEILRTCVAFCGDVDTVATVALAAASRSSQVVDDLPAALHAGLENDQIGRDFLHTLDARLLAWAENR